MFSYHIADYAHKVTSVRWGRIATGVRSSNRCRSRADSQKQLNVSQILVSLGFAGRDHLKAMVLGREQNFVQGSTRECTSGLLPDSKKCLSSLLVLCISFLHASRSGKEQ